MDLLPDNIIERDGIEYLKLSTTEKLAMVGVPTSDVRCRWGNWDEDVKGMTPDLIKLIDWTVNEWDRSFDVWCVVLSGPAGRGKTHLAVSTLARIVPRMGVSTCRYLRWLRFLQEIKDTWGNEGGTESVVIHDATRARFLVIDDLGTEADEHSATVPDWIVQRAFAVLEARNREQAGTLITTNLSQRVIGKRYGERFLSRLRGGGMWIEFPETIPDQRGKHELEE